LAVPGANWTVPLAELRRIEIEDARLPALPAHGHLRVTLTAGEILVGTFAGSIPDGMILRTAEAGELELPFEVVKTIVAVPPEAPPCFEPDHTRAPRTDEDVAYLASGDEYVGIVLAAAEDGLEMETGRGSTRRVAWEDLLVLQLANDPAAPFSGVEVELETVEGARLLVADGPTLASGVVRFSLRSLPDVELGVPIDALREIRAWGGAFDYASRLPFASRLVRYYGDTESEFERAFNESWYGARADRRPDGCPLRLAGTTYRHGIAVHSRSLVTVALDGGYAAFEVLFGIDDVILQDVSEEDAPKYDVDARILGDGEVLWEAKGVRYGQPPRRIGPLDVTGVQELVLEVDFGSEGDVLDRATWANPMLVRE
jgi:hypothetical protein